MAGDAPGHDLYALDPEEFVAARDDLVKELKGAGRREEAAMVAKLRRPSVTAWALDAVARERPGLVGAVLDAGAELRAASERALAGDASGLRAAQAAERRAVDAVTAAAGAHLEAAGKTGGDAARHRMAATLRAAVVDPSVAGALVAAVLATDHGAPGFGFDAGTEGGAVAAPPRRGGAAKPRARYPAAPRPEAGEGPGEGPGGDEGEVGRRRPLQRLQAEADEAEQRSRDAERAATDAERRARQLRDAATGAAAEAERAVHRAEDLRRQAAAAEQRAAASRAEATEAAGRAAEARARAGGPS